MKTNSRLGKSSHHPELALEFGNTIFLFLISVRQHYNFNWFHIITCNFIQGTIVVMVSTICIEGLSAKDLYGVPTIRWLDMDMKFLIHIASSFHSSISSCCYLQWLVRCLANSQWFLFINFVGNQLYVQNVATMKCFQNPLGCKTIGTNMK